LETSHVPSSFKKAALYPTLKKSVTDYEEFSNFRPVSNLKFISKMTEKVVSLRLLHYLRSNGLEELYQSAYKQFHSCETALIRVQNDILREIDGNSGVVLLRLVYQLRLIQWIMRSCSKECPLNLVSRVMH
jgi:hypothetical protein